MASGTRLELLFNDSNNESISFVFPYAKSGATLSNIRNLINTIIANGDIFNKVPVTAVNAKTVTTSQNVYDLT